MPVLARQPDFDDWDAHWEDFADTARRNPAQEYRRRLCLQLLGRHEAPLRLLDIGSGTGDFLEVAARHWPGAQLLGLEMSEIGVARAAAAVPAAEFRVCDLLEGPGRVGDRAGWATHAVCSEVLEHVDDPVRLLRNARSWLAPGCRLVVTVPGGPMSAYDRHIGHRRHFTPSDLSASLAAAGFNVTLAMRAGFPWFNVYRSVVILAGDRLIADAGAGKEASAVRRATMEAAMAVFRPIFLLNLPRSPFGWQTVAVAREPTGTRHG